MTRYTMEIPGFAADHKPTYEVPRRQKYRTIPSSVPTRKGVNCDYIRVSSPLAVDLLMRLETDPRVARISSYPTGVETVVYDRYGPIGRRVHHPEFGVMLVSGRLIYMDAIPYNIQREFTGFRRRTAALVDACWSQWGVPYAVHSELSLHINPQWSNVRTVWRHYWADDQKALMAVSRVIDEMRSQSTIGEIRAKSKLRSPIWLTDGAGTPLHDIDRAFTSVMQLYARGLVRLDFSRVFSDDTIVSRQPHSMQQQEQMKGAA